MCGSLIGSRNARGREDDCKNEELVGLDFSYDIDCGIFDFSYFYFSAYNIFYSVTLDGCFFDVLRKSLF